MLKKTICSIMAASALLLVGCNNSADSIDDNSPNVSSGSAEMKSLVEIRSETENVSALYEKFDNLDLSKTFFYVPEVDKIDGFSLLVDFTIQKKEKRLLDTAEWMANEPAEENNIIYRDFKSNDRPFAECKDDVDRGEKNYFVYYKNDKLHLGINIGGSYIFAANNEVDKFPSGIESTPHFIDQNQDTPTQEYYLLGGEKAEDVYELQDGEIKVSDAVDFMKSKLEKSPLNIDELNILPGKARIYKVGEKYGINTEFLYEYNGVLLDYHDYVRDLETDDKKYDAEKTGIYFDASMVWENQLDQLYGARFFTVKSTGESAEKFVSLEDFLSMISEKLTGNSKFTIDSVELLYGLDYVYPEEYYTTPDTEKFNIYALRIETHPMWVAYISRTGISDAPQMCLSMDAVTGKFEVHSST